MLPVLLEAGMAPQGFRSGVENTATATRPPPFRARLHSRNAVTGWGAFHTFMAVGDFDGDHKNDLAASDASGRMTLFRGNGTGGFLGTRSLGAGWQSFGAVIAARDFDGDGKQDLAAVTMTGQLILYRGNGAGGFLGTRSLGYGWHKFF